MSGYTGNVIEHHGMVGPGFVLVQKPFAATALLARVAACLTPAR